MSDLDNLINKIKNKPTLEDETTYESGNIRNMIADKLPDSLSPYIKQSVADEKKHLQGLPEQMGTAGMGSIKNFQSLERGQVLNFPDELEILFRKGAKDVDAPEARAIMDTIHSVGSSSNLADGIRAAKRTSEWANNTLRGARAEGAGQKQFEKAAYNASERDEAIETLRQLMNFKGSK